MERPEIVLKLRTWLGKDGIAFFSGLQKKYGRVDAIWVEGGIPHPVHFREGMQVRNFLRQHVDWDAHKLDNEWVGLVEEAISEK